MDRHQQECGSQGKRTCQRLGTSSGAERGGRTDSLPLCSKSSSAGKQLVAELAFVLLPGAKGRAGQCRARRVS